jgi:hypothetical protein
MDSWKRLSDLLATPDFTLRFERLGWTCVPASSM